MDPLKKMKTDAAYLNKWHEQSAARTRLLKILAIFVLSHKKKKPATAQEMWDLLKLWRLMTNQEKH